MADNGGRVADNEISIVPFRYKYLSSLLDLLNANNYLGISTVTMKTLPNIGYIALRNGYPVAAGFLRRVEGGYAQLDTLTTNPIFGSIVRNEAIDLIVKMLITDAKDLKLHGIIAFTSYQSIIDRAKSIGFNELEHSLIALDLCKIT